MSTVEMGAEHLSPEHLSPEQRGRRGRRGRLLVGVVTAVVVSLLWGLVLTSTATLTDTPAEGSVDAGFARDMGSHHAQAVEMSLAVLTRTHDDKVRSLATDIALGQTEQEGEFHGWLTSWGLPFASTAPQMAWMVTGAHGHGSQTASTPAMAGMAAFVPGAQMPGMASRSDITKLSTLPPAQADVLFLQLMIRHHQGGVEMASFAAAQAQTPQVRDLAAKIAASQTNEQVLMTQMLHDRGAKP